MKNLNMVCLDCRVATRYGGVNCPKCKQRMVYVHRPPPKGRDAAWKALRKDPWVVRQLAHRLQETQS